jgi:hypothetical protein
MAGNEVAGLEFGAERAVKPLMEGILRVHPAGCRRKVSNLTKSASNARATDINMTMATVNKVWLRRFGVADFTRV